MNPARSMKYLNKKRSAALMLLALAFLSCKGTQIYSHGPTWIIHIPSQWHLLEKGKQNDTVYAAYKRDPIIESDRSKIVPSCMITTGALKSGTSISELALNQQSSIIADMGIKGYRFKTFRKDLQEEIKTAFRINNIVSLAYEYQYEEVKKPFLTIAVYAIKGGNYISINIESSADSYRKISKEIYEIISSIR